MKEILVEYDSLIMRFCRFINFELDMFINHVSCRYTLSVFELLVV